MNRLVLVAALLLAVLLTPEPARAQTPTDVYTFVTIDDVELSGWGLVITGILQGQAAPTKVYADESGFSTPDPASRESCERKALLAMARPGQYLLRIERSFALHSCSLSRARP